MNEAVPSAGPEDYTNTAEASFDHVIEGATKLLDSLEEALAEYPEITIHGKTVAAEGECDQCVARASRLNEGLAGLREQQGEANDHYGEHAAAMLSEGTQLLEGWLKLRADVYQEAERNPKAAELVGLLDDIALKLMPSEAANDESTETEQKEAT